MPQECSEKIEMKVLEYIHEQRIKDIQLLSESVPLLHDIHLFNA